MSPESNFEVMCILVGIATLGYWVDTRPISRWISGIIVTLVVAMALSALAILPKSAPSYGLIWEYFVPLALPLFLLKADVRKIYRETGPMLVAFGFGVVGTLIGVLLAVSVLAIEGENSQLAAALAASYIGGSVNYASVGKSLGVSDSLYSVGMAADNVVLVFYFLVLAAMPKVSLLLHWMPSSIIKGMQSETGPTTHRQHADYEPFNPVHLGSALTLSLAICAVSRWIAEFLGLSEYSTLIIAGLTVFIATLFPRQVGSFDGDFQVGVFFMYLFFVSIGAATDLTIFLKSGPEIAIFVVILITTHLAVIVAAGRLLRLDLAEVIIASNACAAGPTTAAAFAASFGWRSLIPPAILCGILGYAIANFVGVFLGKFWL